MMTCVSLTAQVTLITRPRALPSITLAPAWWVVKASFQLPDRPTPLAIERFSE